MKRYKHALLVFILLTFVLPASGKNTLTIDFSERFRFVSWDNPITLDSSKESSTTLTRNRTSLGLKWTFSKQAEIYFKTTNEFRVYFNPDKDFNIHEIFVDNLYLKVRSLFRLPVTLTIGRQNIFLGEGFIVLDGSTYDGSRSAYFDAIRADINFKDIGKLSMFRLYAQRTDELFPILNNKNQRMNENDIRGYGFYYHGKINKNKIDLYYLNKETDISNSNSWDLSVNTFGTKLSFRIKENLNLTTEGAIQTGSIYNENIRTFGGHCHLDRNLNKRTLKKVTIGGIYLSGNNPDDDILRGWDPPFSKWPKWSESYIYTLINEGGIANWSNISSIYISFKTRLFKEGYLDTTFNTLSAPEKNLAPDFPGGTGKYRGFLVINRLNFYISEHLSGHFMWEHFNPGNFYFSRAENYNWIRFEILYKTGSGRK